MEAQQEVASFALALKTARTASKISQRDIAARLFRDYNVDIDGSGLSRIENGERMPRLDEALALSHLLCFEIPGGYKSSPSDRDGEYRRLVRRVERATAYLNGQED